MTKTGPNHSLLPTLDERAVSMPERPVQRGRALRSAMRGFSTRQRIMNDVLGDSVVGGEESAQAFVRYSMPNQAVEATSTQRTVSRLHTRDCRVPVGGRASPHR